MNAFALETSRSEHSWDIESGTTSHDWACWVPGRHHDELIRPLTGTDPSRQAADADQGWPGTQSVA